MENSFQGLFGTIKTIEIIKELVKIGLNEDCDIFSDLLAIRFILILGFFSYHFNPYWASSLG